MTYFQKTFPVVLASLVLAAPRLASADCLNAKICVNWESKLIDKDYGTREMNPLVPASGARFTLVRPPAEPPLAGILDPDGCLEFETDHASGHKLIVHAEAWIGEDPVHVTTHQQKMDLGELKPPAVWVLHVNGITDGMVKPVDIVDNDSSPFPSLMAVVTEVMNRLDELDALPASPPALDVQYLDWKGNGRADPNGAWIQIGPDSFREKFLIAHEMGHWLRSAWDGVNPPLNYGFVAEDEACQFAIPTPKDYNNKDILDTDAGLHGLRTAETASTAMNEGLAHFIASVVFNNFSNGIPSGDEEGTFRYYKEIDIVEAPAYESFVNVQDYIVSLRGTSTDNSMTPEVYGGQIAWAENMCSDNDWPTGQISTGLDWMRLFWRFLTMDGLTKPTFQQFMAFTQFTEANFNMDSTNAYDVFFDAMNTQGSGMTLFAQRFEDANLEMRVDDTN